MYRTVILPVVLYGCETWSLTLEEEHRLRVFEMSVLRKMDHGENCIMMNFITCILLIKSRRMRWAGHVACIGEGREVYRVLVGSPKVRRPLGRPRHRHRIGINGANWIQLAQDRVQWWAFVNTVMNLWVP
jgi:hypothetical protein